MCELGELKLHSSIVPNALIHLPALQVSSTNVNSIGFIPLTSAIKVLERSSNSCLIFVRRDFPGHGSSLNTSSVLCRPKTFRKMELYGFLHSILRDVSTEAPRTPGAAPFKHFPPSHSSGSSILNSYLSSIRRPSNLKHPSSCLFTT